MNVRESDLSGGQSEPSYNQTLVDEVLDHVQVLVVIRTACFEASEKRNCNDLLNDMYLLLDMMVATNQRFVVKRIKADSISRSIRTLFLLMSEASRTSVRRALKEAGLLD